MISNGTTATVFGFMVYIVRGPSHTQYFANLATSLLSVAFYMLFIFFFPSFFVSSGREL